MNLTSCINPREIVLNGEKRKVPCGKCEYCKYVRSLARSQRLSYEIQSHKFGIFGTLTYADMFLPKMIYDNNNKGFVVPDHLVGSDVFALEDSGNFIPFPFMSKRVESFVHDRMEKFGYIPYLRKSDVQKFMKRLRINLKRILKYDKSENEKFQITYACCGEYGPTTFRPHFHFILLFDCEAISKVIFKVIHKSWPFGSSKSRWLGSEENGGYISKYLNSNYRLPSLFKVRNICPFFVVSKSHPLGLYSVSQKEIQRLLVTKSPTISVFDARKGKSTDLPLWPVLENWFFPKFSGFSCVSRIGKLRLLGFALKSKYFEEFKSEALTYRDDNLKKVFRSPDSWRYDSEILDYFDMYLKDVSCLDPLKQFCNCLKSIFYCANRIKKNMHLYCINSLNEYLDIIEEYYFNKEQYKLSLQMQFEDNFMSSGGSLESLRYLDLSCFNDDLFNEPSFKKVLDKMTSDIEHSHKNKRKNNYLALHPEYMISTSSDYFREGF